MQPWVEFGAATLIALFAAVIGLRLARASSRRRISGILVAALVLGVVAAPRLIDRLVFLLPFAALCGGKFELLMLAATIPLLFVVAAMRMRSNLSRWTILGCGLWVVAQ